MNKKFEKKIQKKIQKKNLKKFKKNSKKFSKNFQKYSFTKYSTDSQLDIDDDFAQNTKYMDFGEIKFPTSSS